MAAWERGYPGHALQTTRFSSTRLCPVPSRKMPYARTLAGRPEDAAAGEAAGGREAACLLADCVDEAEQCAHQALAYQLGMRRSLSAL